MRRVVKARAERLTAVGGTEVRAARERLDALARWIRAPRGVRVRDAQPFGIAGEWLEHERAGARLGLYLHGGAFALGSARLYRGLAGRLAAATRAGVLVPDYRLAPEHPFPAALDDALGAWDALRRRGDPARMWVAGDSAGGGLALALVQHLVTRGAAPPGALALLSPWIDLAATGASVRDNAERDQYLNADLLAPVAALYLQGAPASDPRASPLHGPMAGLPPTRVHVCDSEILRDDGLRLVERMRAAGADATVRVYGDLPHVFHAFAPLIPEAAGAIRDLASHLARV